MSILNQRLIEELSNQLKYKDENYSYHYSQFYSDPSNGVCYNGQRDNKYVIGINLPGLSKEEIEVSVIDFGIVIDTKPKSGSHLTKKTIKVPFSKDFNTKAAKAKIQNGLLELSVPCDYSHD